MSNAMDYLSWRGDLSFQVSPVNEVDVFLFSQLSTPDYSGIDLKEPMPLSAVAEAYFATHDDSVANLGVLQSASVLPMLRRLAESTRFKDVLLSSYENIVCPERSEQFSAASFYLPDGTMIVSFRGTDDTIIGWKEDFNIALFDSVPAQDDAVRYLNVAAGGYCGDVIICGHSKGGNLAVYAAANSSDGVKSRLRSIYNFDGPGFKNEFIISEEYLSVSGRIISIVPHNSVVGLLLNHVGTQRIVQCNVNGPMAHDGFNWEVLGTGFVTRPELSPASKALDRAADDTILKMPPEDLHDFIEEFFDILLSTDATTITEFTALKGSVKLNTIKELLKAKHISEFKGEFLENLIKTVL